MDWRCAEPDTGHVWSGSRTTADMAARSRDGTLHRGPGSAGGSAGGSEQDDALQTQAEYFVHDTTARLTRTAARRPGQRGQKVVRIPWTQPGSEPGAGRGGTARGWLMFCGARRHE